MSESELTRAIKAVQLQLFSLRMERKGLVKALSRIRQKRFKDTHKRCRKCNVTMLAELVYVDERYADGLYPYCRICKSDMVKARNAKAA